jgi:IS5 family transposase
MTQARDDFKMAFVGHSRRARRRAVAILNAKRPEDRVTLYRDLIKVTEWVIAEARRVNDELKTCGSIESMLIQFEIEHFLPLVERVIDQTRRRVLKGESVPATDKIVSIFEPLTAIIIKDRRETYYGHKVCLTSGASGMILDLVVEDGNPADSTLATKMISRVIRLLGRAPRQAAFDGGFSSQANVRDIKDLGVEDVVFSKHVGLAIADMARSEWVFKRLRNFRAGIEAGISWLKRVFGLTRCTWRGEVAFKSYVWASTVAFNLLVLARHTLPSS